MVPKSSAACFMVARSMVAPSTRTVGALARDVATMAACLDVRGHYGGGCGVGVRRLIHDGKFKIAVKPRAGFIGTKREGVENQRSFGRGNGLVRWGERE